jgi:hypothetical protein
MDSNQNTIVETDVSVIEIDKRGFLRISLIDNSHLFDEDEAKRQIAAAHHLTNGLSYKVLVDTTESTNTPTLEAKKIIAEVENKTKEAVLIKSLGNRILGNIYLKLINRRYPSKLFTNEKAAIDWLLDD